jgi:hypothetical protein
MRVNTEKALRAWQSGKAWRERIGRGSIWSNGTSLYSYGTELVRQWNGSTYLNVTRYSRTTSVHQNALRVALPDAIPVDDIPIGGYIDV